MTTLHPVNGDHAEFEIEHAATPPEQRPDWPYPSFAARDWAKAYLKHGATADEGALIGWFANALMRGYDEARARQHEQHRASFFGRLYLSSVRWSNRIHEWRFQWKRKAKRLLRSRTTGSAASSS